MTIDSLMMTWETVIVVNREIFARLTADALSDRFDVFKFEAERNGSVTFRVVIKSREGGPFSLAHERWDEIRHFADGFYAALKRHCSL